MGTKLLARQLRYEDDKEETLMFYAASSTPAMFSAVKRLVRDTIGDAGLAEQLRHNSAMEVNVLMKASNDEEVSATGEPTPVSQVGPPQTERPSDAVPTPPGGRARVVARIHAIQEVNTVHIAR